MKINVFIACLLALVLAAILVTSGPGKEAIELKQEGNNAIYPLGNKYHVFRDGKLEASLQKNKDGSLLTLSGSEVDLSAETLWGLMFKGEDTYKFTLQAPRIGWKWHFFPVEDLSIYEKEKIYYSPEAKNIVKESLGAVTGAPASETKRNIGPIYIVGLLVFFTTGLFNAARIFPNENINEKLWNPNIFYVGLFSYLLLMWGSYSITGMNALAVFFCGLSIALCVVAYRVTYDLITFVSAMGLILFLTIAMVSFFCPTHNFEFFTQYLLFLAILIFVAHFSTKTFLEKRKEKQEEFSREMEEAYSK